MFTLENKTEEVIIFLPKNSGMLFDQPQKKPRVTLEMKLTPS